MRDRSLMRIRVAALCALGVALAACGQKPGVHLAAQGQAGVDNPAPAVAPAPTVGPGEAVTGPVSDPTAGPAVGPVTTDPQQPVGQPTAGPNEPAPGPRWQVTGSDRTGVTDTTITLAAHAPVTGAAPLPAVVFEESADLYWRWLAHTTGEKVLGRDIEIVFQDDRYTPTTARQVCRQLMQVGFSITGVGADGIAACAPLAEQLRVPYIAFGADEAALAGNPWYFAISATYPQQGDLWAQYVRANFPGQKVGAIAIDTVNWDAAVDAWEAGLGREGVVFSEALRHPREGTDWYAPFARRLNDDGVQVVYALTSPLHLIRFAQVARDNDFDFHLLYIAPGALNGILENGCPAMGNATSFSTWPSLDVVDQLDPEFMQAVEEFDISRTNLDLSLALWGVNKYAHHLLAEYEARYGRDLTREDFRAMVETLTVRTGLFPEQVYSPSNHFGTRPGVHVVTANCDREIWENGGLFQTSF
ncbi:MAG: ABC transporter substrate-binding protein [Nitriliruptorales bacterium]|nr:ABC transporter substrate-binding protein [Nitriliruptorales bacterium]